MAMNIETIRRMATTEKFIDLDIPEEEISDEERQELLMIKDEMKRGKEHRLEDVLAELDV
jgi:hypothetical protein